MLGFHGKENGRYYNYKTVIITFAYWLCPFSAARCMAVLSNAFFVCSFRPNPFRSFQSTCMHSRWPFCAAMWRQVFNLVSFVAYSLSFSLVLSMICIKHNAMSVLPTSFDKKS